MLSTVVSSSQVARTFCSECGTGISQQPNGAPFVVLFPPNFEIEAKDDNNVCLYPEHLKPQFHHNYESRTRDWSDELPKFKGFPHESTYNTCDIIYIFLFSLISFQCSFDDDGCIIVYVCITTVFYVFLTDVLLNNDGSNSS